MRPRLLDLFCGAGGAAMGYHRAGFEVVGVDINPQPNYPFEFHQGDALNVLARLIEGDGPAWLHAHPFLAIHTSPPCQGYLNLTSVNQALGRRSQHSQMIEPVRDLLRATGVPYVIENVADARSHLVDPIRICGTGLNLPLRRHRLFESDLGMIGIPCAHDRFTERKYWTGWRPNGQRRLSTVVQVYGNAGGREHWAAAMGIDWMTNSELVESIPPAYTEFIGRQLLDAMGAAE